MYTRKRGVIPSAAKIASRTCHTEERCVRDAEVAGSNPVIPIGATRSRAVRQRVVSRRTGSLVPILTRRGIF